MSRPAAPRPPLYSPEERARRDATLWTVVQGVLAPVQFLACAVSVALVLRFLATGEGYAAATASILVKTALLFAIMVTGSIWEKVVFGRWLFAPAFFWEDVVSFAVIALHLGYLVALWQGAAPAVQMGLALAAYAAYAGNAGQFLWKLRQARRDGAGAVPA
jgi:3-vinyl bacteriochlorophyllide hydratase